MLWVTGRGVCEGLDCENIHVTRFVILFPVPVLGPEGDGWWRLTLIGALSKIIDNKSMVKNVSSI